ncbi:protein HEXIM2 [Anoplophora glabripennis]|nr:protein HEXIM2 [Anoplophora glabripennis]
MSESCATFEDIKTDIKVNETIPSGDVVQEKDARASLKTEHRPKLNDGEIPPKKRKTRRGKSKRRQQFIKNSRKSNKLIKPEAPHNSNQFLLEDHGLIEDLDENLKSFDQVSTSTLGRTRDSSFSVDSDGEFYSSPDDEEQFLIKDFDDQYESLHAERLQAMSKTQLIEEYIMLENKLEQLSKRLQKNKDKEDEESEDNIPELKREVERLMIENERLRRENDVLRSKVNASDSEDSETDSSDSCSSSSSSSSSSASSRSGSPISTIDYSQTNGRASTSPTSVDPV